MLLQRLGEGWEMHPAEPEEDTSGWPTRIPSRARPGVVPGVIQQVAPDHHGLAWYWCRFTLGEVPADRTVLVRFGAVDYVATVYLNGTRLGAHEGGETPFELDATGAVVAGENLLAVRVLNPTTVRIDGMTLDEVPHANKSNEFWPGRGYNTGGIRGEVTVRAEPLVRLGEVVVVSNSNGELTVQVETVNETGAAATVPLAVTVREDLSQVVVARAADTVEIPAGDRTTVELRATVDHPRPWELDDPFLYAVAVAVAGPHEGDGRTIRTGFRELRVEDGWFLLNGRRTYLRCTHTGNHYPLGQRAPAPTSMVRQDLVFAKASGFNAVRFIAGLGREDQLSFCDEIGLMVYEEPASAWLLGESPEMAARFDRSVTEMVRRDRNHPSVVIWGLLNETRDGAVFRHAVETLATVRALDPHRLVLLSSGRWDGDLSIGSFANPGSDAWEHQWGAESPETPPGGWVEDRERPAYVQGAGDLHFYPHLPESASARATLSTMGAGTGPVLLSEYGIGSLFDAPTEAAEAAAIAGEVAPLELNLIRSMADAFARDWERFEMGGVYCFPEDAARASQAHQSVRRAIAFDLIRGNPQIAGYNLTGMLDHALTGEGS